MPPALSLSDLEFQYLVATSDQWKAIKPLVNECIKIASLERSASPVSKGSDNSSALSPISAGHAEHHESSGRDTTPFLKSPEHISRLLFKLGKLATPPLVAAPTAEAFNICLVRQQSRMEETDHLVGIVLFSIKPFNDQTRLKYSADNKDWSAYAHVSYVYIHHAYAAIASQVYNHVLEHYEKRHGLKAIVAKERNVRSDIELHHSAGFQHWQQKPETATDGVRPSLYVRRPPHLRTTNPSCRCTTCSEFARR